MSALDRYDPNMVDDENYSELSQGERAAAEASMRKGDRAASVQNDRDLLYDESNDKDMRRKRRMAEKDATEEIEHNEIESIENLEDTKGHTIKEWVCMLAPRNEIANRFESFLRTYTNSKGQYIYKERIRHMCESKQASFSIKFTILASREHVLADFLLKAPFQMLEIFDEVAKHLVLAIFPSYGRVTEKIHVRISELLVSIELLTFTHPLLKNFSKVYVNKLVRTSGVVIAITPVGVLPQLSIVKYNCSKCGYILGLYTKTQNEEIKPNRCPECQNLGSCINDMEQTIYQNYQKITIQESPGRIPAGRIPHSKNCILLSDLVDRCKPGDEVDLTAIYTNNYDESLNTEEGFPVFSTVLLANHLHVKNSKQTVHALTSEKDKNKELAKQLGLEHKWSIDIRSALMAESENWLTAAQIKKFLKTNFDEDYIPFREFGFRSFEEMLETIDNVESTVQNGVKYFKGTPTIKTEHIHTLVKRLKSKQLPWQKAPMSPTVTKHKSLEERSSPDQRLSRVAEAQAATASVIQTIKHPIIPVGSYCDVQVVCVICPQMFTIQLRTNIEDLNKLTMELTEACDTYNGPRLKSNLITTGSVYAVKDLKDKKWYRACVVRVMRGDVYLARCCDAGVELQVPLNFILPLDKIFYTLPYQAMKAELFGIKAPSSNGWSDEQKRRFQSLTLYGNFKAIIKASRIEYYSQLATHAAVSLDLIYKESNSLREISIIDVLVRKGLALKEDEMTV